MTREFSGGTDEMAVGRLQDKVAIITGGASGIGKATAEVFAENGAKVVLGDIDVSGGQETAGSIQGKVLFTHLDSTQEADWVRAIEFSTERFGSVDIVVNNAGIEGSTTGQNPENISLDEIHSVNAVNVDGVLLGCKHAIRAMRDTGGAIVNISSIGGIYATPTFVAYGASKGAVRQLTKSVAAYCGRMKYGIRCNSIHPGITETRMGEEVLRSSHGDVEAGRRARIEGIPVGRIGVPRDIANAVLYLASEEASFVNGAELVVDGGQLIL
jgi:NAD(P)-dependent dehydrogenase (short-subunit alcohol dehydrogenase family)